MDITVLKKITMGRTWGVGGGQEWPQVNTDPSRTSRFQINLLLSASFFPSEMSSKYWKLLLNKQHFYQATSSSTYSLF